MICAICTSEVGVRLREFDGKATLICERCENEHPRDGGYSFTEGGGSRNPAYRKGGGAGSGSGEEAS